MSKERPILFSTPMVRAILAGGKTQTRRIIKWPKVPEWHDWDYEPNRLVSRAGEKKWWPEYVWNDGGGRSSQCELACPYGATGDRLWVRETWYCDHCEVQSGPFIQVPGAEEMLYYRADSKSGQIQDLMPECEVAGAPWRPSIHMPRWASRIVLEIESVRVERLQDITEADAKAEGISVGAESKEPAAINIFRLLWESINGPGSWDANPWVWVVTFKRIGGGR